MLFQKSLVRELRATSNQVLTVLIFIVLTIGLIRALGRAANGKIDIDLVLPLILFGTLNLMSAIFVLASYLTVLIILTRWWKDSEMIIWLTSGKSLFSLIKPIWSFVWPIMITVAILSFFLIPWAREQLSLHEQEIESRNEVQRLAPGLFRESSNGSKVYFIENPDDEEGRLGVVFVRSRESSGKESVILSSSGYSASDRDGQNWITLTKGFRTDFEKNSLLSQTMSFDQYRVRVDSSLPLQGKENIRSLSTISLMKAENNIARGELYTRINFPLLAVCLSLLAIPLAVVNTRAGRSYAMAMGILLYFFFSNIFTAISAAISKGALNFFVFWWVLPLIISLVACTLIFLRERKTISSLSITLKTLYSSGRNYLGIKR